MEYFDVMSTAKIHAKVAITYIHQSTKYFDDTEEALDFIKNSIAKVSLLLPETVQPNVGHGTFRRIRDGEKVGYELNSPPQSPEYSTRIVSTEVEKTKSKTA